MTSYSSLDTVNDGFKTDSWRFINLLPFKIKVYMYRPAVVDLITEMAPASQTSPSIFTTSRTKKGMRLKKDDAIHVTFVLPNQGKELEVLRPEYLFDNVRDVRLGEIVYEDKNNIRVDLHSDIMGIRFHNHIAFPIEIYHRGKLIGRTSADDGTDFMAGSPNSVYLNNERFGFQIGDEVGFNIVMPGASASKRYASITIIDNYVSDIIIGKIGQQIVAPRNDSFSYRVEMPNLLGQKFYHSYQI